MCFLDCGLKSLIEYFKKYFKRNVHISGKIRKVQEELYVGKAVLSGRKQSASFHIRRFDLLPDSYTTLQLN